MKKMIIAACAAFFAVSTSAVAQSTPAPQASEQKGGVQEEIRATSGQLKETYGAVSQQLNLLKKEIGPDASAATPAQSTQLQNMKTSLAQLEGMLTTVNTANEAQWPEIKQKAEQVRAAALKLVAERKTTK